MAITTVSGTFNSDSPILSRPWNYVGAGLTINSSPTNNSNVITEEPKASTKNEDLRFNYIP